MRDIYTLGPYEPTAEESAEIKQALKHDDLGRRTLRLAQLHTAERDEAVSEVERGLDDCAPDSWVAHYLDQRHPAT